MVRTFTAVLQDGLSEQIKALAAALKPALSSDAAPSFVAPALADIAIKRHRVGPLLEAAARGQPISTDADANLHLQRHVTVNKRRTVLAELEQQRLIKMLAAAGIPILIFKGVPMARQLYGDPVLRHTGDIDLLVPPGHFRQAVTMFHAAGYIAHHAPLSPQGRMSWLAAQLLRDVGFINPRMRERVELHQRLLFLPSLTAAAEASDASLCPRLPTETDPLPTPALGPALTLYLLQHGALSGWRRLKWLADMAMALRCLSATDSARLPALAEACGTAISARAGLALVQTVFGTELPVPLDRWVHEAAGARIVARRLALYARELSETSDEAASHANSRIATLKLLLLLCDRPTQRRSVLLRGPAASALRLIGSGTATAQPIRRSQAPPQ